MNHIYLIKAYDEATDAYTIDVDGLDIQMSADFIPLDADEHEPTDAIGKMKEVQPFALVK